MNQAKFQVGQQVAVCTTRLELVILITDVRDRMYVNNELVTHPLTGQRSHMRYQGWAYLVHGFAWWLQEKHLRLIAGDEYKDTLQGEQPINTWRGGQHKSPEEMQRMMHASGS